MRPIVMTVCGGGSGGHVTPLFSLIESIQQDRDLAQEFNAIYRFGEKDKIEHKWAKRLEGVIFVPIYGGKRRRYYDFYSLIANIQDLFAAIGGFFQSVWFLYKYQVDVVFCKGGYISLPVGLAAAVLNIPLLIHESDKLPGLTNKVLQRFSLVKFGGFPDNLGSETVYVGQLLSPELVEYEDSTMAIELPRDAENKTVVLVMGGSQGARKLYEELLSLLQEDIADRFHFLVSCGSKNSEYKSLLAVYDNVTTFGFLSLRGMSYLYYLSDIAITRGGATSLAEQQLFGIKKIIVPTPYTGGDHQLHNAQRYEETYGDILIRQDSYMHQLLIDQLLALEGYKKKPTTPTLEDIRYHHKFVLSYLVNLFDPNKKREEDIRPPFQIV